MSNSEAPQPKMTAVRATEDGIDRLAADLRMFATGSYLKPEEREHWEPLFDKAVADDVAEALREAAAGIDQAADLAVRKREPRAEEAVTDCLRRIAEIERAEGGSIFDEELEEILAIVNQALAAVGLDAVASADTYAELA